MSIDNLYSKLLLYYISYKHRILNNFGWIIDKNSADIGCKANE